MLILVVYDKKYPTKTLLKKRYDISNKYPDLCFGDLGIALKKTSRFEYSYFLFFRKFLKKLTRKKKKFFNRRSVWMSMRPNIVLTKKSKNSRMGKGKGSFVRWCSLLRSGFILVEFYGFKVFHIKKYAKKLENRLKLPLVLVFSKKYQRKLCYMNFYSVKDTVIL